MNKRKSILLTGGAGFIGRNLTDCLLRNNFSVHSIDNFDEYYSKEIKVNNIKSFSLNKYFSFQEIDVSNLADTFKILDKKYDAIIHLAAIPGVRNSILFPEKTTSVNIEGTRNLINFAIKKKIKQFIFSSSSSIYGNSGGYPWEESLQEIYPINPYAISKLKGEEIGLYYSSDDFNFISLRLFSVYGRYMRPDLAISKFTSLISKNKSISVFGDGSSSRDFTYIDDILHGFLSAIEFNKTNFEIFNLGSGKTTSLISIIKLIEKELKLKAKIEWLEKNKGEADKTHAKILKAQKLLNYTPKTSITKGITNYINWFKINKR